MHSAENVEACQSEASIEGFAACAISPLFLDMVTMGVCHVGS